MNCQTEGIEFVASLHVLDRGFKIDRLMSMTVLKCLWIVMQISNFVHASHSNSISIGCVQSCPVLLKLSLVHGNYSYPIKYMCWVCLPKCWYVNFSKFSLVADALDAAKNWLPIISCCISCPAQISAVNLLASSINLQEQQNNLFFFDKSDTNRRRTYWGKILRMKSRNCIYETHRWRR